MYTHRKYNIHYHFGDNLTYIYLGLRTRIQFPYPEIMYTSTILVHYRIIDRILECNRKYNLAGYAMMHLKLPAMIVNLYLDRQLSSVPGY
jgi:hypothetical protein